MNVAYDLEFDLDAFLRTLEKGRSARQRGDDRPESGQREDTATRESED